MSPPPRPPRNFVLATAFGLAIALALGLQGMLLVEIVRARRDVERLFAIGNRTHFHLNQVGLGVSRLRALALETLTEAPSGFAQERLEPARARAHIARLERVLDASVPELWPLLGPDEAAEWSLLVPELQSLRSSITAAFEAAWAGRTEDAEALLDDAAARSTVVQEALARLVRGNAVRSELLRAAADERLEGVIALQAALAIGLALALGAIGAATSRLLRAQRAQLDDYVQRLEVANRDLDQFAGRVAHDLRNVLQPVGLASALLERGPDEAVVTRVAQDLKRTNQHASQLIEALLGFARAVRPPDSHARAPVREVVEEACELLHHELERGEIDCRMDVEDGEVACDRTLLATAVVNVLGNALKHLAGRPVRQVRIDGRRQPPCFVLVVTDTGAGIPPEALPHVFDPFYRALDASGPGLGLGLATVKRIVEAHSGRVDAGTGPEGGAQLRMTLPLAPEADELADGDPAAELLPCQAKPSSS